MIRSRTTLTLALAGTALIALTLAAVSLHIPGSIWVGTIARKDTLVALIACAVLVYFASVAWVRRHGHTLTTTHFAFILTIGVLARLILLPAPPFMSTDIYRYVWDGRVQSAGINPYLYIPADPALAALRNATIYPRINRATYAHTIYPPAAQLLFQIAYKITPTITGFKAILLLCEAAGVFALLRLLALAGLPRAFVLIYLWNPLAIWAVALDGHIDGAAIGLVGLAMWAATINRRFTTGVLIAAATLTKFLPVLVVPALWQRRDWRLPLAAIITTLALYSLYLSAGTAALGFLPAYTHEENLVQGPGFWPLFVLSHALTLPSWASTAWLAASATALAALGAHIAWGRIPAANRAITIGRGAALLAGAGLLALTPHYPWYYAWLALPCAIWPTPGLIFLSAAPVLLYSDPFHDEVLIQTAVFLPAILLISRDLWRATTAKHIALPAPGALNAR